MSEDEKNAAAEAEGDLKRRRDALKGVLTRLKNKIDLGLAGASLQMLKLLEEQAITTFRKYETITLEVGDDEDPSATESCYYECIAALRTLISFKEGLVLRRRSRCKGAW